MFVTLRLLTECLLKNQMKTYSLRIPALKEWRKEKQVRIKRKKTNVSAKPKKEHFRECLHKNKFTKKCKDEKYPLFFF